MSKVRFSIGMSIDGYLAGPNPTLDDPLGEGGMQLHEWVFPLEAFRREHGMEGGIANESTPVVEASQTGMGAFLMGRNMFGGGPGPWPADEPWTGWWGEEPPFHTPVFVLTHHEREPLEMEGGTTFQFVTDGIESALEQARAAGEGDVQIGGGAEVIQQYLAAGLVDEMWLNVVPVLFGGGTPLFDETTAGAGLEQVRVIGAPGVVHLNYRRGD
jgi:dihydrofolate reductase